MFDLKQLNCYQIFLQNVEPSYNPSENLHSQKYCGGIWNLIKLVIEILHEHCCVQLPMTDLITI